MSDHAALEIAFRRMTDQLATRSQSHASTAAASVTSTISVAAGDTTNSHSAQRQFIHGVGPLYVAKTKNPTQYPDWSEIQGIPDSIRSGGIDPATIELDGSRIATGTVSINRLPVAGPGEANATTLVRSDDPRLTQSVAFTLEASGALLQGRFVTASGNSICGYASAAAPATAAIGYIADDYGVGQQATIWRDGDLWVFLPDQDGAALMQPVYLGADGMVRRTMPLDVIGGIVQQVGVIVGLSGGVTVRITVTLDAYEEVL